MTKFARKAEKNQMLTIEPLLRAFFASVFCPQARQSRHHSGGRAFERPDRF
jgi:hypothetical protein